MMTSGQMNIGALLGRCRGNQGLVAVKTLLGQAKILGQALCPRSLPPRHPVLPPRQIVESTGSVMAPYMDFPELLAVLLKMLHEGTAATRREVMKVLGIIGALDPHTHKTNQASLKVWGGSVGGSVGVCGGGR